MMENSTVALVPDLNEITRRRRWHLQSRVCLGTSIILLAVSMLTMRITLMKISYWRFPLYSPAIWGSVMFLFAGVLTLVKERKNLEYVAWATKMMCILSVVLGGLGIIVESAVIASETKYASTTDDVQRYGTSISMVLVVLIESTLAVVSLILACKSSRNCCSKTGNNEPQLHSHLRLITQEALPGLPMYEQKSNEETIIPPAENPPAYSQYVDDETDTNTPFLPFAEMHTLTEPYEFTNPPPYSTAPSGIQLDESTV